MKHIHSYMCTCMCACMSTGILAVTGMLIVMGRKKSMAATTAILATFNGLLYLCAGRYSVYNFICIDNFA